jgi:DNA polymerase-3 subunit delta'
MSAAMSVPSFDNILGQDQAIDFLRRAYESNRLPHGLVFAGPSGVGKATTALALAALFLCHNPKGTRPCSKCDSCRIIAADTHPDLTLIYRQLIRLEKEESKAKELTAPVIRQYLIDRANLTPVLNHGRVFIVEEAELMNATAQNSLLKTLEEPFGKTLIILLSDQPESLLPTIRSRTQLVRFHALDPAIVTRELTDRGIDKATAQQAAGLSEGSVGLALKWIEDGVIPAAQQLLGHLDQLLAGRLQGDLADWFKSAAEAHAKKQQDRDPNVSLDQAKREALSLYLRIAAQYFRRMLRESDDQGALEVACTALETIARADDYLDANVNIPIIFQQLAQTLGRLVVA